MKKILVSAFCILIATTSHAAQECMAASVVDVNDYVEFEVSTTRKYKDFLFLEAELKGYILRATFMSADANYAQISVYKNDILQASALGQGLEVVDSVTGQKIIAVMCKN